MKPFFLFITLLTINSYNAHSQFNVVMQQKDVKGVGLYYVPSKNASQAAETSKKNLVDKEQPNENSKNLSKTIDKPKFSLPLANIKETSSFGMRFHPIDSVYKYHNGIDLRAKKDTVYSVFRGIVENSGFSPSLGYFVKINFNGYIAIYAHLAEYYVLKGEQVEAGDKIGKSGNTGKSTGEHLHFSLKKGDRYINPKLFLNLLNNQL